MSNLIDASKFEPGMILAAPILNRYGQVLVGAGVELKESHKKLFMTWGIKLITVKDDENKEEIVVTEEMQDRAEKIFLSRIKWKPTSRFDKDLFSMGVNRILKRLSKGKNNG